MKFLKPLIQLGLFSFVLSINAQAQPGKTCVLDYNPFEIRELAYLYGNSGITASHSSEVFEERINSQYIFIGKYVSQESEKMFNTEKYSAEFFTSIKVNVIKEIAGNLGQKIVTLNIKTRCWQTIGTAEIGSEYIFFANEVETESFKGIVSTKWSAALDGIPKSELNKITKEILDYRNGVKQPLVVGYLTKQKPNPYWDYWTHSFNGAILWRSQKFKNDWRIKKWEYDPEYAEPLKGVKITAKRLQDGELLVTKTDSSGRFEFADLPKGDYVVYPDVPKSYLIVGKCYLNDEQKGGVGFSVPDNKRVCDRTIRLDVAPAGKIEAEIRLEQGSWKETSRPDIYLVGANSKTNEVYQDYLVNLPLDIYWDSDFDKELSLSVDKVIAGEYVLKIGTAIGKDIYYPGVRDVKKAKIIEIKEAETTKISFSISSLKN